MKAKQVQSAGFTWKLECDESKASSSAGFTWKLESHLNAMKAKQSKGNLSMKFENRGPTKLAQQSVCMPR
jgi:predicted secreted protein